MTYREVKVDAVPAWPTKDSRVRWIYVAQRYSSSGSVRLLEKIGVGILSQQTNIFWWICI